MKKGLSLFIALFFLVIIICVISVIAGYNSLVDADVKVSQTESQVVNRLNQRQDLINQLLPTVVGLEEHASDIYNQITSAREAYSLASNSDDLEGMIEADALQALAINHLLAVMEDNPENIFAGDGFLTLMDNISGMESAISQARKDYNDSVAHYNGSVRKFPNVIYASLFGFEKEKPYWKMNEGADEIPQIVFVDN